MSPSHVRPRVLFVHPNFPGQFLHLAAALAAEGACEVHALAMASAAMPGQWQGVHLHGWTPRRGSTPGLHPWVVDLESKAIRAEAALNAALALRAQGLMPQVIVAHPGWGDSLGLKDVWPQARLGLYCEFFYQAQGADVGFDPEFGAPGAPGAAEESLRLRLRFRNAHWLMQAQQADAALAPTHWQANTFPEPLRGRMAVIHDGIDTTAIAPNPAVRVRLRGGLELGRDDEVVTFVSRNLEPQRGYHVFMRALPDILSRRPRARVLIVGGEGPGYGANPPPGQTWKQRFAAEVRPRIGDADWARVHFLGNVPREPFTALLQLSSVHVYLTYPFVLSWSLLEAMSAGCAIVASDTAPVREVIEHGHTGRLVDFFDAPGLADAVCALLDDPQARQRLGSSARAFAQAHYDLRTVCLPRQLQWVRELAGS